MSSAIENSLPTSSASAETALLLRSDGAAGAEEPSGGVTGIDRRLHRIPMRLHVLVRVHSLRVGDLLALAVGTAVESVHEHSQDVPVHCGGALLMWAEFEVVETRLAVRITRLA